MDDFVCRSQGLFLSYEMVPCAMESLQHATDQRYYIDIILERWGDAQRLPRFALVPPLLQHVGIQCSDGKI